MTHHCPDFSGRIEDGKLEGGPRLAVQFANVCLFWEFLSTKGRRQIEGSGTPVGDIQKGRRLVDLGGQIQGNNRPVLGKDNRVDFHVGEI